LHPHAPRRWFALGAAFVFLPACAARDDAPPETFTVRDSAGIRIVENTGAVHAPGAGWTLSDEPIVRIGVVHGDPAYEFSGVVGLTRLSDGRIVVLDEQTKELRFYSPEGVFLESIGRAGAGPGELESPGGLQRLPGDTLQVTDFPARVRYTPDGSLVDDVVVDWMIVKRHGDFYVECSGVPQFVDDRVVGCSGAEAVASAAGEVGLPRRRRTFITAPIGLTVVDTLARLPAHAAPWVLWEGRPASLDRAWIAAGFIAFGGAPTRVAAAAEPQAYSFEIRDLDGGLRTIIRRLDGMRSLTPAELQPGTFEVADQARLTSQFRNMPGVADFDDLTPPDSIPLLNGLFIDTANRIWGSISDPSLGVGAWHDLFDADGRYLGPVRFPDHFEIFEIGADYVLGVARDELDVEFVELYRLIPPG
jgi:hypothetical protein